ALLRERLEIRGEPGQLLRTGDVSGQSGRNVALEEDEAADLDAADQPADLLVAVHLGAAEADEQQLGDARGGKRSRGLGGGAARAGEGSGQREQEEDGQRRAHQPRAPRAASTSRRTRRGSTGLARTPSRLTPVPTMRPSARDRSSAAVSAVAPLPTSKGASGTAPRTRLRSAGGGGVPRHTPRHTTRSAQTARND